MTSCGRIRFLRRVALTHVTDEAIPAQHSGLVHRHLRLTRSSYLAIVDIAKREPEQLGRGLVAWQVTTVLDDLA